MVFSKICQILFVIGSTILIFHSGVPQQFLVVFLVVILGFWRPNKSFSSISYLFFQRFMVLASCHPHNCFWLWQFFSPIRSISWVVSISFLRRPSCHNSSFSACSYRSPNLTGASFKYPLISSWPLRSHVSKSPQVSSFVFQFFPVNCAFPIFFSIPTGGSLKTFLKFELYLY